MADRPRMTAANFRITPSPPEGGSCGESSPPRRCESASWREQLAKGLPVVLHAEPGNARPDDRRRQHERPTATPGDVGGGVGVADVVDVEQHRDGRAPD